MHGCGRFFNAARDTVSDKFIMTYKAGEPKPESSTLRPHGPVETYEARKETRNERRQPYPRARAV